MQSFFVWFSYTWSLAAHGTEYLGMGLASTHTHSNEVCPFNPNGCLKKAINATKHIHNISNECGN